jgi:AcrR family transcriptional regulator
VPARRKACYPCGVSATTSRQDRPRRLSQPERSAATRQALLDSTIDSLVEVGYDKATTLEISEGAGLSRGAHLHHFKTRASLFAAATAALAERVTLDLQERVERLPDGKRRLPAALDMIWELFTGPLFQAVLELAVHARTDPEMRASLDPVERMIGRESRPLLRRAFGRDPDDDQLDGLIALSTATIRGLAILPLLDPDYDHVTRWESHRATLVGLLERA